MEAELSCCVKDSGAWDGYSDVVENVYYSGSDLCSGSTLFLLCRTLRARPAQIGHGILPRAISIARPVDICRV